MERTSDTVIVPPACEPLSRTLAKLHLKESTTAQDALIDGIIAGARQHAEDFLSKAIVLQTRLLQLECLQDCIEIAWGPVRTIESVKYLDEAGDLQTLDSSLYRVDLKSSPARIVRDVYAAYPTTYPGAPDAVQVTYTAGMLTPFTADASTDVLTAAAHGFADGDLKRVQAIGTIPTGLAEGTNYYVINATANTFKVSLTSGGAAVDVTAAGTPPNLIGMPDKRIELALLLLIQYFEQRDGNEAIKKAAEDLLQPIKFIRF